MNITREELIDFLKSDIVNACHIFDGDYSKAADVFFEKFGEEEKLKDPQMITIGFKPPQRPGAFPPGRVLREGWEPPKPPGWRGS